MATVYSVPDISCQHCVNAITEQVSQVAGVEKVSVDLATKTVTVSGAGNDAAVRAAIDEAGYAAV